MAFPDLMCPVSKKGASQIKSVLSGIDVTEERIILDGPLVGEE